MHDPRALLLSVDEVAARLGWPPAKVRRAIHATDPLSDPKPFPGWINIGSEARPRHRVTEQHLIDYIKNLPEA